MEFVISFRFILLVNIINGICGHHHVDAGLKVHSLALATIRFLHAETKFHEIHGGKIL